MAKLQLSTSECREEASVGKYIDASVSVLQLFYERQEMSLF
jgi:hypothetical protein